jgi:hypothetical protein
MRKSRFVGTGWAWQEGLEILLKKHIGDRISADKRASVVTAGLMKLRTQFEMGMFGFQ